MARVLRVGNTLSGYLYEHLTESSLHLRLITSYFENSGEALIQRGIK